MKQKAFFIIFKDLSLIQINKFFRRRESNFKILGASQKYQQKKQFYDRGKKQQWMCE